jgi:hypothetical protein
MGKVRLPFIDSDLLYRGVLKAGLTVFTYVIEIDYQTWFSFIFTFYCIFINTVPCLIRNNTQFYIQ